MELLHLTHQVDVQAELQDVVHHGQLAEDDGVVLAGGAHSQEAADQEDEGHVQANDAEESQTRNEVIQSVGTAAIKLSIKKNKKQPGNVNCTTLYYRQEMRCYNQWEQQP